MTGIIITAAISFLVGLSTGAWLSQRNRRRRRERRSSFSRHRPSAWSDRVKGLSVAGLLLLPYLLLD